MMDELLESTRGLLRHLVIKMKKNQVTIYVIASWYHLFNFSYLLSIYLVYLESMD